MDDQIMEILSQIMNGLAEIHRLGFIHCDIHPANILMREAFVYCDGKHVRLLIIVLLISLELLLGQNRKIKIVTLLFSISSARFIA